MCKYKVIKTDELEINFGSEAVKTSLKVRNTFRVNFQNRIIIIDSGSGLILQLIYTHI